MAVWTMNVNINKKKKECLEYYWNYTYHFFFFLFFNISLYLLTSFESTKAQTNLTFPKYNDRVIKKYNSNSSIEDNGSLVVK